MKRLCLFVFFLGLSLQAQQTTRLSGHILNATTEEVLIEYCKDLFTGDWKKNDSRLDAAGRFSVDVPIQDRGIVYLEYAGYIVPFYLEEGQSLSFTADRNQFENSLKFNEKGGTANNKVLQELRSEAGVFQRLGTRMVSHGIRIDKKLDDKLSRLSGHDKKDLLFSENNQDVDAFERKKVEHQISPEFDQFMETHLRFKYYTLRMWCKSDKVLSSDFSFFRDHIYHPTYRTYLDEYVLRYCEMQEGNKIDYYRHHGLLYESIWRNEYLPQDLKEEIVARLVYRNIRPKTAELVGKWYEDFLTRVDKESLRDPLKKRFQAMNEFGEGKAAPWFELKDNEGAWISLDAYQGRMVYLTFWASWCAPCIDEFYQAEAVRKELKQDLIEFVFINIDDDKNRWLNHLITKSGDGVHVSAADDPGVRREYKISELPRHFLIDEEGSFIQEHPNASGMEFINFVRGRH